MAVDVSIVRRAAHEIAAVEGVASNPAWVVEDVFLLARVFPDELEFSEAIVNTIRALRQLRADAVDSADLVGDLDGWRSYHYQHRRLQGQPADMRIVFRKEPSSVCLRAFGHRRLPLDIYRRIATSRA